MSNLLTFFAFEAIPLSKESQRVLIRWSMKKDSTNLADYEFYIDRGDAPNQSETNTGLNIDGRQVRPQPERLHNHNLLQIAGPISALDFYEFIDQDANFWDFYKVQNYQIRCRRISTQEDIKTPLFSIQGELDPVGLYIVDEENFLLEDSTGEPSFFYVRRSSGVLCECVDPVQMLRKYSNCTVCYGTNWVGGFYKELSGYVNYSPSENVLIIEDWGQTQPNEIDVKLANYPRLAPGDVIRELRRQRMWRVVKIRDTEKRRVQMLQFARLKEINLGDIEYKIPYNEPVARKMITEFEIARRRREF